MSARLVPKQLDVPEFKQAVMTILVHKQLVEEEIARLRARLKELGENPEQWHPADPPPRIVRGSNSRDASARASSRGGKRSMLGDSSRMVSRASVSPSSSQIQSGFKGTPIRKHASAAINTHPSSAQIIHNQARSDICNARIKRNIIVPVPVRKNASAESALRPSFLLATAPNQNGEYHVALDPRRFNALGAQHKRATPMSTNGADQESRQVRRLALMETPMSGVEYVPTSAPSHRT